MGLAQMEVPMPRSKGAREAILEAATDLFAEFGYDATPVQQIVERAGVTKGALYHHFAAKEDILFHIYGDTFAEQLADLDRVVARGDSPGTALREVIVSLVTATAKAAKAASVFSHEITRMSSEHYAEQQQEWRRYQDTVRELIARGQREGAFRAAASPLLTSWAIFGVTNSMHSWFKPDGPKTAEEIAAELADLIMSGIVDGGADAGSRA
jgi:AcrR family transcriptional regulator